LKETDNSKLIEARNKLGSVRTMRDFGLLLKFLDENNLTLYSRRGTKTTGRRRAYMFDKDPIAPERRITYLYDDGKTSGSCLLEKLSQVFTVVEVELGTNAAGEWETFLS
jgi:hypothetical protein